MKNMPFLQNYGIAAIIKKTFSALKNQSSALYLKVIRNDVKGMAIHHAQKNK